MAATVEDERRIRVWDPLVRVFHWSLAGGFLLAFFGEEGDLVHRSAGYVLLGLIAIRLAWGFIGPTHARFADFVRRPSLVAEYLRGLLSGRPPHYLGHNPAGGWMVVLLLAMVAITAGSGWLSVTNRFWGDPLVAELHEVAANLTFGLVCLHWAGVIVSSLAHRENLVMAMITGAKAVDRRERD